MTPKLSDPPATNGTVQPFTPPAAKVTPELSDPPDSDGTAQLSSPSGGKVTSELSEPPVAKVTSELSEPPVAKVTSELSEPLVAKVTSELSEPPVAKVTSKLSEPPVAKVTSELSEPPVAKVTSELSEPPVAKVTSEPPVAKVKPEPSVAKVTSEPSVAKVTPVPEPSVAKVTSEPPVAKVTPEPSVAKVKTEPSNPPVAKVTSELSISGGTAQLSSPPAANGTHQLYQVVPVVQNGVQCRLLMPLNMVPSMPKVVTAGVKVVQQPTVRSPVASSSSQLPAGNSKFVLQQVKVAQQPGSTAASGTSAVVHVLSPAGTTAAAGGARPGKDGKVASVAPGTVISSSGGQSTTGAIGKVIAVTPTIAPGGKVVLPPAAPVTTPVKPGSTVIQVPGTSMASPSAVYNIIKVTPPPPGGTLTIGPNTRLVVVSAPSTGVTQSLGPRTSAALGSVAVVTPTVKSTTSAKPTIVKTHTTLPVGKPMVATSAGQHKIVIVPQTTVPAQTTNMIIPHTSTVSAQATARVVVPTSGTSTVPAAPKHVSMVQQNENVVLINGQPYKLVPCPTTTHIPVDALKSTAAAATVSSAAVQTAATVKVPISSAGSKASAPAKVTVSSVHTVAPTTVTFSAVVGHATQTQVTASNNTALTQTQVTASTSTAGGVTSVSEGSLRTDERSGSETETASEASPVESKDPESSEAGEGSVNLKIDSVYSLKDASKAPGTSPCRPSISAQTITQNSSAASTLKNIANIHSAVVNTPQKYIVVYPNKPAVPPSPPRASTQTPVTQTATKRLEPAETKPATPPASPIKRPKPAEKQPSPKSVTTPKSVTEMYHSYAKGKAETPEPPAPQVKRSVTALMVRTTPLGKSTVSMGQDPSGPPSLPPSKIFRLEPPRPNETIQDERVRRLKEILREREAAVEELRKRKKT
ncbi:mucin-5AC-like [Branchiostoma floridae]|uniref:Mucin-5AC-like n=1 Tax=Branchiostoma floridae TaxID=7739 RepID=A0A9J7KIP9_BRAFL|nr:mucin-5AC-like [Branchiostoma floridae]